MFIIGTVVILFGAYFVTYFIGTKATGQSRTGLRNRNISLLDRYAIARDKQFCIIEIAGKVYIVGVTNHTMTLLDTFDAAAFAKLTENNKDTTPWASTPVGQYGNKLTKMVVAFIAEKTGKNQQSGSINGRNVSSTSGDGTNETYETGRTGFAESMKEAKRAADDPQPETNAPPPVAAHSVRHPQPDTEQPETDDPQPVAAHSVRHPQPDKKDTPEPVGEDLFAMRSFASFMNDEPPENAEED